MGKSIKISKREMIAEHENLLKTLNHPTKSRLLAEKIKQKKELEEYKRK